MKWRVGNRDKLSEIDKRYYVKNADKRRDGSRKWTQENPLEHNRNTAAYRARKLKATPVWLTEDQKEAISDFYLTCPPGYHVDHIIPLKGKNVCGLHVPWNLQHLPAQENLSKRNFLDERDSNNE
jgi:hypothetical protein